MEKECMQVSETPRVWGILSSVFSPSEGPPSYDTPEVESARVLLVLTLQRRGRWRRRHTLRRWRCIFTIWRKDFPTKLQHWNEKNEIPKAIAVTWRCTRYRGLWSVTKQNTKKVAVRRKIHSVVNATRSDWVISNSAYWKAIKKTCATHAYVAPTLQNGAVSTYGTRRGHAQIRLDTWRVQ